MLDWRHCLRCKCGSSNSAVRDQLQGAPLISCGCCVSTISHRAFEEIIICVLCDMQDSLSRVPRGQGQHAHPVIVAALSATMCPLADNQGTAQRLQQP